jgi:serine/threonine-protein kinase
VTVRRPRRLVYGGSALVLAVVTAIAGVLTYSGRDRAPVPFVLDGTYRAEFGPTLTLGGGGPSPLGSAAVTTTLAVRSTCPTDGCVAVATVSGDGMADAVQPRTATSRFVLDSMDGAWVSVAQVTDGRGTEQWRVLSLRPGENGGLTGTYSYVGDGRGAQRAVTFVRTGDAPPQGSDDPASLPPRTRSPAQNLRGEYTWTRTAVNTTAGQVDEPTEVVLGLKASTNCLRTGERCFSLLSNPDKVGFLMTYANGKWSSRSERDFTCRDGGSTRAVRTFELPMPATVPDPIALLTGRGHMENTGDCAVSTDTEVRLQRSGD